MSTRNRSSRVEAVEAVTVAPDLEDVTVVYRGDADVLRTSPAADAYELHRDGPAVTLPRSLFESLIQDPSIRLEIQPSIPSLTPEEESDARTA